MIYWVVLVAITATCVSLPFIYVDISVQGNGVVRPIIEKTEITAPMAELVDTVYVKEGQEVKKGEAILRFRTSSPDVKMGYQREMLNDYQAHVADLTSLARGGCPQTFHSPARQQEYQLFVQKKREMEVAVEHAQKDYQRNKYLYEQSLISEEEYDKYYFELQTRKNELTSLIEGQLSTWQADLNSYRNQSVEIHNGMKQEQVGKDLYVVRSPVSGTLDQFSGIYKGSTVQAGQTLAVVSPASEIYAEAYVQPRDIGYLEVGMPVKVQVESFNYNEWGMISGEVVGISSDYLTDGQGNAFFKVKCKLGRDYLTFKKTQRKGYLKKGMTVSVRFMITRRSLFSLLYQSLDDWVNPTQCQNK